MDPTSSIFGIAIILATFLGPIIAVVTTRMVDGWKEIHERRMSIFRTLMATRAIGISPERVAALNMIQIDFAKKANVTTAWHRLLDNYGRDTKGAEGEQVIRERNRLTTELLGEMAKVLGIKIGQLDILDRVYYPVGLQNLEMEQHIVRRFFVEMAEGQKALPVLAFMAPSPDQRELPPQ